MSSPAGDLIGDPEIPWRGVLGLAAMLLAVLGTILMSPQKTIELPTSDTCQVEVSETAGPGPRCDDPRERALLVSR